MNKVTIIIPVYNVEGYIETCLKSVACQSYKGGIECLIIDDCGNDESISLAQNFICKTTVNNISFRIIHHEFNKGLSGARNTGIRESSGDWIYFLDADDKIIPECIELMMNCVNSHPDTQTVIAGASASNKKYKYMDYEIRKSEFPDYCCDSNWINYAFLKHEMISMTAWNVLLKRSFILKHSLFFKEGIMFEDEIFHFQLANTLNRLSVLKKNTYIYVVRDDSIINSTNTINVDRNWLIILDIMVDCIIDKYRKRQVASIFYYAQMRIKYSSDPVLRNGIKKILIKLARHATLKQSIGLWICGFAPIDKMEEYMKWSERFVGNVVL